MSLFTFADSIDSLMAYMGSGPGDQARRDACQAIDEALRELVNAHTWSYLYTHGRLNTHAPYTTGTVEYLMSSGTYPYQLTLTDGVWPSWAADGYVRIANVTYRVDRRLDDVTLTLLPPLVPAADVASTTIYQLYQDTYLLPADFIAQDQGLYEQAFAGLTYIHPRDWLFRQRFLYNTGIPQSFTIDGDGKYPGRLVVRLSPLPTDNRTLDFLYKRRPRPIIWPSYSAGTIALTAGDVNVVGTGTAWDPTMAGSVLRTSANSALPTWMPGANPATSEGLLRTFVSPTLMLLAEPATVTYTAAKYVISDPVDIEVGSMLNAFLRCCEHKLSQHRIMKDKPSARVQYLDELIRAKEADSRSFAGRAEGETNWYRRQLKDMPRGPDQS